MKRRDVLKGLLSLPLLTNSMMSVAQTLSPERVLVVVFMRGGWDGLNVVVPYRDDDYYSLRPNIAIRPPSDGNATSALDLDGFFGFHPALTGLHDLYQSGQVAVMPAVHYPGASRSHFSSQDVIEAASPQIQDSGWLGRYLLANGGNGGNRAFSVSSQVPLSLSGLSPPVSAYPDLTALQLATSSADRSMLARVFARAYGAPSAAVDPNVAGLYKTGEKLLNELGDLQAVGQLPVDNGAMYPMGSFGRQLKQAASLIKARAGLKVVTLNMGGWDTHSNQGGGDPSARMSLLLREFSEGVQAFFTDLGVAATRVLMLTTTEFGRTAAENGSKGTDHGNASTWMAIGPNVRGGIHLKGRWPGLASSQLVDGRALAYDVDFRSVYSNVLSRFLGATNLSAVLPGFSGDGLDVVA